MTNYERDAQSSSTIKKILDEYNAKCPKKENFALQVFELGIILKEAFPDVNRVQRRVNGARTWQYPLAKTTRGNFLTLVLSIAGTVTCLPKTFSKLNLTMTPANR